MVKDAHMMLNIYLKGRQSVQKHCQVKAPGLNYSSICDWTTVQNTFLSYKQNSWKEARIMLVFNSFFLTWRSELETISGTFAVTFFIKIKTEIWVAHEPACSLENQMLCITNMKEIEKDIMLVKKNNDFLNCLKYIIINAKQVEKRYTDISGK